MTYFGLDLHDFGLICTCTLLQINHVTLLVYYNFCLIFLAHQSCNNNIVLTNCFVGEYCCVHDEGKSVISTGDGVTCPQNQQNGGNMSFPQGMG